jgi:hypothetical protein
MRDHAFFEERIRTASQTGNWDRETTEHLQECAACAEQAEVSRFMSALADAQFGAAPPDAQVVKLKAQILRRGTLDVQTAHRISTVQRVVWGAITAAWIVVIGFNWARIAPWMEDFDLARIVVSSITGTESGSLGLLLILVSLASLTAMVAVHAIFSEE